MPSLDKKINVLWLVDHLGYGGVMHGAGTYYLNTIPLFDKSKFNVSLCALRGRDHLTGHFEDQGIKIRHLGRGKLDPVTIFDLVKLVKEEKISLIHAHGYGSANFGRLAGVITGAPVIIHSHDHDHSYNWYQSLSDRLLSGSTSKAIAVSESVKESCVNTRKIPPNKVVVMHNGIRLERFRISEPDQIDTERKRLDIYSDFKIVGTVTRLREEKGNEYLLAAAPYVLKEFPRTVFLLVGDGPLREELENYSRELGIDKHVIFAGFREDIVVVMSLFDINVLASLTEGSPGALLEAMAMGKPIVATNVGGIKEILKDGETGLLVPSKNPEALSEKIMYLLRNKDRAKTLGERAKEESGKYDINLYVRRLEEQYCELLSSGR